MLVPRRAGEPVAVLAGRELVGRHARRPRPRPRPGSRRPSPFGSEMWPGCIMSVTSTTTSSAAPLGRHAGPAAVGEAEPRRVGRAASAARRPGPSCARTGSRKIVLAVNERRSPAESTNGKAGSAAGGLGRAWRARPAARGWRGGSGRPRCRTRRHAVLVLVDRERDAGRAGEDGVEQRARPARVPRRRSRPGAPSPGTLIAQRWAAPHRTAAAAAPSGRVGPSVR